jgi:hypothetical protein
MCPHPAIMKTKLCFALVAFAAVAVLHGQELQPIPSGDLAKITQVLMDANAGLGDLPLKLDLAADQAMGFKTGDVGALLIPDRRLKTEKGDKADRKKDKHSAVPVGQLWTSKLSPKEKGAVLPNEQLRLVKVKSKDKQAELAVFALGIEKSGKKEFQLVLYGKGPAPVLRVPMVPLKAKGSAPVVLATRKSGEDGGVLELKLLGRFKAEIPVGKQAD